MKSAADHEKALADMRERMLALAAPSGQEAPENPSGDLASRKGKHSVSYTERGRRSPRPDERDDAMTMAIEQFTGVLLRMSKSLERIAVILDRGSQNPVTHKDGERLAYRVEELAKAIGVNSRFIRNRITSGDLRAYRAGKTLFILVGDADEWIRANPIATDEAE